MTLGLPTLDPTRGASTYTAYTYSYPHKSSYRQLTPRRPLREAWEREDKSSLFFYVHVPFCEMRCGFCNLFTTANPSDERVECYLAALEREAEAVGGAVGPAAFARAAVGGGTPTYLTVDQLARVFEMSRRVFGVDPRHSPTSVETSPRTADAEKLQLLRHVGVSRISIGVQSLIEREVASSGRAQKEAWVTGAIGRIRDQKFPTLNTDLIYGLPGQTVESWSQSVRGVLQFRPEEIYLYPLYVRPLTGLGRWGGRSDDGLRLGCYRRGRDMLLEAGYEQLSMRMFRLKTAPDVGGPVYCCQDDGMLGVGCGARSYTTSLHYSQEYAVAAPAVRDILARYAEKSAEDFSYAHYGCGLDEEEQRRRWVLKSLLRMPGLSVNEYRARFGSDVAVDLPELSMMIDEGWICRTSDSLLQLTPAGLEQSDAIGPMLYSPAVRDLMARCELA
jgi:oxygen-independent coproporphyrinogen III oxidase